MNLQGKIEYIKNAVTAIKNAIIGKGVTPTGDLSTYADAIGDIEIKNNTSLTVNPSTSSQTIRVPAEYTGYDVVTVNPVTSAIDLDIVDTNIKEGCNILGVNGSVIELKGETRNVTANGTYTPSSGKNGITSITVNVPNVADNLIKGNVTSVDTTVTSLRNYAFANCTGLTSVTLRSSSVVDLSNNTIFQNTPIASKTGNIYVPNNLLSSYVENYTTWSNPIQKLSTHSWIDITFGRGKFVALGSSGYVSTSIDGGTWGVPTQEIVSSSYSSFWHTLAYGNNKFVAINSFGYVSTSLDGDNWSEAIYVSQLNLDGDSSWLSLVYTSRYFVALSYDGDISYSSDGLTWSEPSRKIVAGTNGGYRSFVWDFRRQRLVAISEIGFASYSSSPIGSSFSVPQLIENLDLIHVDNRRWCSMVANTDTGILAILNNDGYISIMLNNELWSLPVHELKNESNWTGLAYGNNKFVALNSQGFVSYTITKYNFLSIS